MGKRPVQVARQALRMVNIPGDPAMIAGNGSARARPPSPDKDLRNTDFTRL